MTAAGAETPEEKVRIVFGSRLLGPAEQEDRAAAKREQSTLVAGVLVPPRPEEPDNCCMSGCVNCVWDRYGEDLEEWTAKKMEAEETLRAMEMLEEEAYSDVPMSIREFIKLEKRLRDKHKQEGTAGG
ncbi:UPF0651 protein [Escovopsis weberi]|uniref:UPF0651 protein n=1 Tax=Escovopsis weberi TaxID=150374 RepID=A0A0M8N4V7_ESCWE|nr:UPF0651 protein [Escovopsis weberi]